MKRARCGEFFALLDKTSYQACAARVGSGNSIAGKSISVCAVSLKQFVNNVARDDFGDFTAHKSDILRPFANRRRKLCRFLTFGAERIEPGGVIVRQFVSEKADDAFLSRKTSRTFIEGATTSRPRLNY